MHSKTCTVNPAEMSAAPTVVLVAVLEPFHEFEFTTVGSACNFLHCSREQFRAALFEGDGIINRHIEQGDLNADVTWLSIWDTKTLRKDLERWFGRIIDWAMVTPNEYEERKPSTRTLNVEAITFTKCEPSSINIDGTFERTDYMHNDQHVYKKVGSPGTRCWFRKAGWVVSEIKGDDYQLPKTYAFADPSTADNLENGQQWSWVSNGSLQTDDVCTFNVLSGVNAVAAIRDARLRLLGEAGKDALWHRKLAEWRKRAEDWTKIRAIEFDGANAQSPSVNINGIFKLTGDMHNKRPVYKKVGSQGTRCWFYSDSGWIVNDVVDDNYTAIPPFAYTETGPLPLESDSKWIMFEEGDIELLKPLQLNVSVKVLAGKRALSKIVEAADAAAADEERLKVEAAEAEHGLVARRFATAIQESRATYEAKSIEAEQAAKAQRIAVEAAADAEKKKVEAEAKNELEAEQAAKAPRIAVEAAVGALLEEQVAEAAQRIAAADADKKKVEAEATRKAKAKEEEAAAASAEAAADAAAAKKIKLEAESKAKAEREAAEREAAEREAAEREAAEREAAAAAAEAAEKIKLDADSAAAEVAETKAKAEAVIAAEKEAAVAKRVVEAAEAAAGSGSASDGDTTVDQAAQAAAASAKERQAAIDQRKEDAKAKEQGLDRLDAAFRSRRGADREKPPNESAAGGNSLINPTPTQNDRPAPVPSPTPFAAVSRSDANALALYIVGLFVWQVKNDIVSDDGADDGTDVYIRHSDAKDIVETYKKMKTKVTSNAKWQALDNIVGSCIAHQLRAANNYNQGDWGVVRPLITNGRYLPANAVRKDNLPPPSQIMTDWNWQKTIDSDTVSVPLRHPATIGHATFKLDDDSNGTLWDFICHRGGRNSLKYNFQSVLGRYCDHFKGGDWEPYVVAQIVRHVVWPG